MAVDPAGSGPHLAGQAVAGDQVAELLASDGLVADDQGGHETFFGEPGVVAERELRGVR